MTMSGSHRLHPHHLTPQNNRHAIIACTFRIPPGDFGGMDSLVRGLVPVHSPINYSFFSIFPLSPYIPSPIRILSCAQRGYPEVWIAFRFIIATQLFFKKPACMTPRTVRRRLVIRNNCHAIIRSPRSFMNRNDFSI